MKKFEITLTSPMSAGNLGKIINAMDVIHQAEFAFLNDRYPIDSEKLYLTMSFGSIKIEGFGKDDGAIGGLIGWLKEIADPRYRKLISQEIEKRDKLLLAEDNKERIESERQRIQLQKEKLDLFDRLVDMSNKISKLQPEGQMILSELTKSVRVLADANDDGLISYISELRE